MIIQKPYIFITGAPRSGTSMVTKIIDAHPDVGIFMENIFGLRRRHWVFPDCWHTDEELFQMVSESYGKLIEPVVGNKVCTPDVWNTDEILRMCNFFISNKLIFVVRDPVGVVNSRLNRERNDHYSNLARKFLGLDWRNKYYTYISSWRQSIEIYWKLKDMFQGRIKLIYYDDFVCDVKKSTQELFGFLGMDVHNNSYNWYKFLHHDSNGDLVANLKYKDEPVKTISLSNGLPEEVNKYMTSLPHYKLWLDRGL